MKLAAVIFDLDGTLVDTERLWSEAIGAYLMDHGCDCPQTAVLRMVYGRSWIDIHRELTERFHPLAAIPAPRMADALRDYYLRLRDSGDGVVIASSAALLKRLAGRYPVIVVSGSPRADVEESVRLIGAADAVRFVLGAEDYAPGKPDPAGFLLGAARLGVPPAQCLVFEDSWAGVTAAKRAGMWCVALSRQQAHPQEITGADWVLEDLADFSVEAFAARLAP